MKKVILTLVFGILLTSCIDRKIIPIEQYRGKGIVVLENPDSEKSYEYLWVKNKDSTFYIKIPTFDAQNLKMGDTL